MIVTVVAGRTGRKLPEDEVEDCRPGIMYVEYRTCLDRVPNAFVPDALVAGQQGHKYGVGNRLMNTRFITWKGKT